VCIWICGRHRLRWQEKEKENKGRGRGRRGGKRAAPVGMYRKPKLRATPIPQNAPLAMVVLYLKEWRMMKLEKEWKSDKINAYWLYDGVMFGELLCNAATPSMTWNHENQQLMLSHFMCAYFSIDACNNNPPQCSEW
jgi:hypothetical protein